mmetsp:Transcript_18703/g.60449  ORF Transcript_18703/g.60449 Transcript_18703/m.60449 type:complete len:370 (-) Transcript_18703:118-1227(-)
MWLRCYLVHDAIIGEGRDRGGGRGGGRISIGHLAGVSLRELRFSRSAVCFPGYAREALAELLRDVDRRCSAAQRQPTARGPASTLDDEGKLASLEKAHAVATFGHYNTEQLDALDEQIQQINAELDPELDDTGGRPVQARREQLEKNLKGAEKERRNMIIALFACLKFETMKKFRMLGFLQKPPEAGQEFSDLLQAAMKERVRHARPHEPLEDTSHIEAANVAMLEVAMAFGWKSPFQQIGKEGELVQHKLDRALNVFIGVKNERGDKTFRCAKHGGKHDGVCCCPDTVKSAASKMEAEWHLRPYSTAEKKSGAQRKKGESESDDVKYKLNKVSGVWTTGLCVEPTLEAHERYSEFISEIKGKYEQEDV